MAFIQISSLSKSFGETVAVDTVTMEIAEGSFTSFLGPSGCGKTTLLRMIAGLEEPDEGEIRVRDKIIFSSSQKISASAKKRQMGLVFQSYALWPHMTVFDNVAYGLKTRKVPKNEIKEKAASILSMMKMGELKDRYPSELSGGQQQRVAISRMLAVDPTILLMDEPLSNLDAKLRMEMRTELKRLHRDTGITIIYVTHDQIEAFSLSTCVAVMDKGRIQQYDTPESIYDRPGNLFVAGFIGTPFVNLMPGKVSPGDTRTIRMEGDFGLTFPEGFKDSHDVVVAVRPEDLTIHQRATKDAIAYTHPIDDSFNAGSNLFLNLTRETSILLASVDRDFTSKRGDTVYVAFSPSSCNVYDREGENILDSSTKPQDKPISFRKTANLSAATQTYRKIT
jgi:multiple sugar transport system ATP-binding protein